jgi:tetratricopeptide (TPR) repeat protein
MFSATLGFAGEKQAALNGNHSEIVKYQTKADDNYVRVAGNLEIMASRIRSSRPSQIRQPLTPLIGIPGVREEVRNLPGTLEAMVHLADIYLAQGKAPEAFSHLESALAQVKDKVPEDETMLIKIMRGLVHAHDLLHNWDEAVEIQEKLLDLAQKSGNPDFIEIEKINLGKIYGDVGRNEEAQGLYQDVLQMTSDGNSKRVLTCKSNLGMLYLNQGLLEESERIVRGVLEIRREKFGCSNVEYLATENNLGEAIRRQGRTAEAITLLRGVLEQCKTLLGTEHPISSAARSNLVRAYSDAGRSDDSLALTLEGVLLGEFPDARHVLAGGTIEEAKKIGESLLYILSFKFADSISSPAEKKAALSQKRVL